MATPCCKAVAAGLRRVVQFDDVVYRMGGDEFIVVSTRHAASRAQVESLAECLRDTLAMPLEIDGRRPAVGASIGIGVYPDDGLDVESLLKHADVALYQAKNQGRNEYRFYSAGPEPGDRRAHRTGGRAHPCHRVGASCTWNTSR